MGLSVYRKDISYNQNKNKYSKVSMFFSFNSSILNCVQILEWKKYIFVFVCEGGTKSFQYSNITYKKTIVICCGP